MRAAIDHWIIIVICIKYLIWCRKRKWIQFHADVASCIFRVHKQISAYNLFASNIEFIPRLHWPLKLSWKDGIFKFYLVIKFFVVFGRTAITEVRARFNSIHLVPRSQILVYIEVFHWLERLSLLFAERYDVTWARRSQKYGC